MHRALIVYTSLTGGTEQAAHILVSFFKKSNVKADLREVQQVNAKDFLSYDICVVGTYTFGADGDLPDEMYGFYKELETLDLKGKIYGVMGSGDSYYGDLYCKAVDEVDRGLMNAGALKGAESVKIELSPGPVDVEKLKTFVKNLIEACQDLLD